jgi:hypothetical protein
VNQIKRVQPPSQRLELRRLALLVSGLLAALPSACKDRDPCDSDQQSIGTGCFPRPSAGGGGTSSAAPGATGDGGALDSGGATSDGEPVGNPDATFGTSCETNADCGGDAPVCATDPLFYCSQIECQEGEANAGACPEGWTCLKYLDNPSACVNLSSL